MVENCLMDLPYVADGCIVGVPQDAHMELCGAVVRLRQETRSPIRLTQIRSDLAPSLAPYMMPTLLRILVEGEELPRNASAKVMRSQVLKEYFGKEDGQIACIIPADVEQCAPVTFQF